jgi:hypothetical protein
MTKNEATQILALEAQLLDAKKSLRDEFAMAALTGEIANSAHEPLGNIDMPRLAAWAYRIADAMMEARKK